jgi:hypothetical protein
LLRVRTLDACYRCGESIGLDEAIVKSILLIGAHNRGELKRKMFASIVLVRRIPLSESTPTAPHCL